TLYFEWNPLNEIGNSTYFWNAKLQKPERLAENRIFESVAYDPTQRGANKMYYCWNGILYAYTKKLNLYEKVIHTEFPISNLVKLKEANYFVFQMQGNLFRWNSLTFSL